ncbi:UNVERIFIED_CONTAM: hypothetical protein Slati_0836900 [Sesamum latifolium]|uniref:Reverse transcriptase n=1 Tax=Sesamum latifolium TaxID=2727402 RepID=A0AAW2XLD3_9LAMI
MIVAVEYFSKWVEAETLAKISKKERDQNDRGSKSFQEYYGLIERTQGATGETPFCLVYGSEAIIPAEIGEETAQVTQYEQQHNSEARSFDLNTIEEKRDRAYQRILYYKKLMVRGYNQKVKPRSFQVSDLVLKKVEVSKHMGKLDPTWEGPYKMIEIKKKGTYSLQDLEGKNLPRPWNIHNLKTFYA